MSHDFELPEKVEVVFIALLGKFGGDGQIQKILEDKEIPYTGQ